MCDGLYLIPPFFWTLLCFWASTLLVPDSSFLSGSSLLPWSLTQMWWPRGCPHTHPLSTPTASTSHTKGLFLGGRLSYPPASWTQQGQRDLASFLHLSIPIVPCSVPADRLEPILMPFLPLHQPSSHQVPPSLPPKSPVITTCLGDLEGPPTFLTPPSQGSFLNPTSFSGESPRDSAGQVPPTPHPKPHP